MSSKVLLKKFLLSYNNEHNLKTPLEKHIPKKWQKFGDFVLFDERTFSREIWKDQGPEFWMKLCEILQCKRVGIKNKITSDGYRTPNVTIVHGSDPWIFHKDNSIRYAWNVEKCMFSAGNVCEKLRIAKLNCENEVVVDLFAGIGYFTLPFLVHSKAKFVHACEWNPDAVEALKLNLKLNKVDNRCSVKEGDNRLVCPKKVGNRVNLGLIPSSENYWDIACEALVDEGGILHIHENVETKTYEVTCKDCSALHCEMNSKPEMKNILLDSKSRCIVLGVIDISWKHKQWFIKGVHILHSLVSILTNQNSLKNWLCSIENVSFVKSYAPHVNHLVYDVKISSS